ncbi:MAG: hypothetical protein ACP5QU_00885 [Anaerolineae bacterium]
METLLRSAEEVELLGPWTLEQADCTQIAAARPSLVVIADDEAHEETIARLTAEILEHLPELPVIRAGLNENIFRVFSAHTLPARGADLMEIIRNLPA